MSSGKLTPVSDVGRDEEPLNELWICPEDVKTLRYLLTYSLTHSLTHLLLESLWLFLQKYIFATSLCKRGKSRSIPFFCCHHAYCTTITKSLANSQNQIKVCEYVFYFALHCDGGYLRSKQHYHQRAKGTKSA